MARDATLIASLAFECPKCKWHGSRVKETRMTSDGDGILRHRKCGGCGFVFSTVEVSVGKRMTAGQLGRVLARVDAALGRE